MLVSVALQLKYIVETNLVIVILYCISCYFYFNSGTITL